MTRRYLVLGLSTVLALSLAVPALGGPGNPVASTAVSAAQALKKAKKAKQAATAAQATADTALSRADNAQVVAVNAENAAKAADAKAVTADNKATAAQAAAAAAQASANAANANANTRLLDTTTVNGTPTLNDATDSKSATATCPAGDIVTGGGYEIGGTDNADEAVVLESTYGDAWFVGAQEINGTTPGNWSLTARAICGSN
jgi:hypothetical protein